MLSMQPFPLSGGWILSVPTADYLTARGIRIEGRGVRPDIETPSAAAPSAARAYLAKRI
jgi:C-terminal processing protease CtpA/Prc